MGPGARSAMPDDPDDPNRANDPNGAGDPNRAEDPNRAAGASPLIGVAALADRLTSEPAPVLLDVRWTLSGADRAAYQRGHLPGAVFVDLDADLAAPPGGDDGRQGRHPLPEPAVLQHLLRRAGVDAGTPVVVYGERDTSAAARAWWLLRWAGLGTSRCSTADTRAG